MPFSPESLSVSACLMSTPKPAFPQPAPGSDGCFRNPASRPLDGPGRILDVLWNAPSDKPADAVAPAFPVSP